MATLSEWATDEKVGDIVDLGRQLSGAWSLVHKLARTVQHERHQPGRVVKVRFAQFIQSDKPDDWAAVVQNLECKIVAKREALARLEECRAFERETEDMLVTAVGRALEQLKDGKRAAAVATLMGTLTTYEQRLGPRPGGD